jgi:hypothetical protein
MSSSPLPDYIEALLNDGEDTRIGRFLKDGEDTGGKADAPLPHTTDHFFQVSTGPGRAVAVVGNHLICTRNSTTTGARAATVLNSLNNSPLSYASGQARFLS